MTTAAINETGGGGLLEGLSRELAGVVERIAPSVVRVDDGSRLTATGLVWREDGVILTTAHGLERDDALAVERADGTRLEAALVGRDHDTDLAVLRVAATDLPAAPTVGAEEVRVGQLVLALGRPGTLGLQATIGIVSGRQDTQTGGAPEYILSTDAALYPGFSGGPLVDMAGRVVGINNRMFGYGDGVALGVPLVRRVAEALLGRGQVSRGYLGVRTQRVPLPEGLRATLENGPASGLLIVGVESGSAAERGGLLLGDLLLRLNGQPLEDADALRRHLRSLPAGQAVGLHIVRGGEGRELAVTLGTEP